MTDMGVCSVCNAGSDGAEVELNENGLCVDCAKEESGDGMGAMDMGTEEE